MKRKHQLIENCDVIRSNITELIINDNLSFEQKTLRINKIEFDKLNDYLLKIYDDPYYFSKYQFFILLNI